MTSPARTPDSLRILGIDPGTARMGYAILDDKAPETAVVAFGCFETPTSQPPAGRLLTLYHKLQELIRAHRPDVLAVEKLFFSKNVKTAMAVGEARGVILLAASEMNLAVSEYAPDKIKLAVTGYGKAEKSQVQKMVQQLLHLTELPKPDDAADALAIAVCHAQSHRLERLAALAN